MKKKLGEIFLICSIVLVCCTSSAGYAAVVTSITKDTPYEMELVYTFDKIDSFLNVTGPTTLTHWEVDHGFTLSYKNPDSLEPRQFWWNVFLDHSVNPTKDILGYGFDFNTLLIAEVGRFTEGQYGLIVNKSFRKDHSVSYLTWPDFSSYPSFSLPPGAICACMSSSPIPVQQSIIAEDVFTYTMYLSETSEDSYIRITATHSPVPIPSAFWLFGSCLTGLAVTRGRKK